MYTLEGVSSVHYCLRRVSIKPRLPFSNLYSLFSKAIFFTFNMSCVEISTKPVER